MTASLTNGNAAEDEGAESARAYGPAMVATPMVMIVAVRMPARMTARASGRRTRQRICELVMPMGFGGFENGGIDAGETDVRVAENGEQSVENERDDGGAATDAANEGDRNEKRRERGSG